MRASITDVEALRGVQPRSIRAYLRIHGWSRVEPSPTSPDVWQLTFDSATYEVIAPSSSSSKDFVPRVAELLRTLSIAEDRSELDVLRDVTTMGFDIHYIHTEHGSPTGTAPLRDAAAAFAAAQAMLSASTATLEEPALVLPARRPTRTAEFMKHVLAGPTSAGSYVLSIWVPVPPRLTQEEDAVLFDPVSEPFERRATVHLNGALLAAQAATREALHSDVGLDAFISRAPTGVSANLCEALTSLAGEEAERLDINFAWALDRPVPTLTPTVSFAADELPVLQEAARELRERIPEERVDLRGNVVRLHREGLLGPGEVTLAATIIDDPTEKLRRVGVELAESDYDLAIRAHKEYLDVEMSGSLVRRGTRTYLRDTTAFTVRPIVN